jgi:putative membrane protein
LLTLLFGIGLLSQYSMADLAAMHWLHAKLTLVVLLFAYHGYCGKLVRTFNNDANTRSHVYYRWFNEVPVVILIAIIILVVVRPF